MNGLTAGAELAPYEFHAYNYATESENPIHSDAVAAQYGFGGGLVPGVGDYAYMTRPVVEALGRAWLESGSMKAKFIKPVYDGERAEVRCTVSRADPPAIEIELLNAKGELCAVGEAQIGGTAPEPNAADYPRETPPRREARPEASLQALPKGRRLGSVELELKLESEGARWNEDFRDDLEIYRGPEACCHPGRLLQMANDILVANVKLGPWIHTASEVTNFAIATDGESLELRGRVAESFEKRGHEYAVLDLALFGRDDRALARILHTAIVRLSPPK